ncbi:MAG: adenylyl-sulfate kinase [Prosthecobacter sp.]|uniref:adenylyl-sulfate kinase n=1 Tax=Prosthecobacter sp. TaxID=1965333 RepID=UPI0019E3141B|nr:adenylyl-sulfate kinase [Prosthecobacter sp.]MBE2285054.1 adenylyl-sulfate kinase [Prosthecobacter sp.]
MPPTDSSLNITQTKFLLGTAEREMLTGHHGLVVWMTGLSGAGKSSIAVGLDHHLNRQRHLSYILDGDNLRSGLCMDLSFSEQDRSENIRRAGEVAKLMAEAGLIVICALISPFAMDRKKVRESCDKSAVPFMEVFINAPLEVCEQRDPKKLYQRARAGSIPGFTGIDSPYEAPVNPEVELRTDLHSLDDCIRHLAANITKRTALEG